MNKTRMLIFCALFTALIAVGAFIKIPIPPVPKTLQLFFVICSGAFLGAAGGFMSSAAYLLLGLIGLPIFTGGGGFGYIFKPTFGYIIAFTIGGWLTGFLIDRMKERHITRLFFANLAGLTVIYVIGVLYLYYMTNGYVGKQMPWSTALFYGVLLPLPGDVALCYLAALITKRIRAYDTLKLKAGVRQG
ncbi:MAG: biotin transporter BioY [Eubacteriales bacterium]|nr:biotin transporter BioY [Eubacteriales bacterium]